MKRLIIHSGLPKTGSSALQVFLAQNAAALRAQSLDYFPLSDIQKAADGQITSGNGFEAALSLLPDTDTNLAPNPASHLAAIHRATTASFCETGLISSEYFAHADPEKLAAFVTSLNTAGISVESLFFIRAQTQALSSMYVQYVKRSLCRETPEAYIARTYRTVPYLKYATHAKTHAQIFGVQNLKILRYEDTFAAPNGLLTASLAAIGATDQNLNFSTGPINLGLTQAEIAIMRELNKYRPHTRLSDILVTNAAIAGNTPTQQPYSFIPPQLATEIETYFAAENAELCTLYFDNAPLFPPAQIANNTHSIEDVSPQDVINVLGGLLVRYDERLAQLEAQQTRSLLSRVIRKIAATPAVIRARA